MLKHILSLCFILVCIFSQAQNTSINVDALRRIELQQEHKSRTTRTNINNRSVQEDKQYVSILVKGDLDKIKQLTQELGGIYKYDIAGIASISLPMDKIDQMMNQDGIKQMEISPQLSPMADSSKVNTRADKIVQGLLPDSTVYTGEGVIVGFIDEGIDWENPDFTNEDGSTRILAIWDQRIGSPTKSPGKYGYGQLWDSTDINNGTCTHSEGNETHGTGSVGIAAGNGANNPLYKGYAYESDIIMCVYDNSNFKGSIADAIKFMFEYADSLNKPCVINTSVGTYSGTHDGTDLTSQIVDSLLSAKTGRSVVASAGNAGSFNIHLGYNITNDTSVSFLSPYAGWGNIRDGYHIMYADSADFQNAFFSYGIEVVDTANNLYRHKGKSEWLNVQTHASIVGNLDSWEMDSIFDENGVLMGHMQTKIDLNDNNTYIIYCWFIADDTYWTDSSNLVQSFYTTGSGRFDAYSNELNANGWSSFLSNRPNTDTYPEMTNFKFPNDSQSVATSWQCLPSVIAVGNYRNRVSWVDSIGADQGNNSVAKGLIDPTSSSGPTRTGLMKPDICAPGKYTMTTHNSNHTFLASNIAEGNYYTGTGTSISSPAVAGIVALYLQAHPEASTEEILDNIKATAYRDNYTTSEANNTYGYGKIDAFRLLSRVTNINYTISADTICFGDSTSITLTGNGADQNSIFLWDWDNNGSIDDSTNSFNYKHIYDTEGDVTSSLTIQNGDTSSQNYTFNVFIKPPATSINIGNDTTVCNGDSLEVFVSENFSNILWSNDSSTTSTSFNAPNNITVSALDSNACIVRDTLILSRGSFDLALGNDTILCTGDSLIISPSLDNLNFRWYDNDSTSLQKRISDTSLTLTIYVEDSNNCTGTDTILISSIETPMMNLTDRTLCSNESLTINLGHAGKDIQWSNGSTNNIITLDSAGTYSVTVTDQNCIGTDSFTLAYNSIPNIELGNDTTLCTYESITLSLEEIYDSILWSNNSTNNTININQAGTYIVNVYDSIGCNNNDTIIISYQDTIEWNIDADTLYLCPEAEQYVEILNEFDSYNWSGAKNENTNYLSIDTSGKYIFSTTQNSGCSAMDSFTVIYTSVDYELAFITSVSAPAQAIFGNQTPNVNAYNFNWYFGDGETSVAPHVTHDYTSNGIYDITLIATHKENGCKDTLIKEDEIEIDQLQTCPIEADITFDTTEFKCIGDSLLLSTPEVDSATYRWFYNGRALDDSVHSNEYYAKNTGYYYVNVTNHICSKNANKKYIHISDSINIPIIQGDQEWDGCTRITLSTTETYENYLWSDRETDPTTDTKSGGEFTVTVWNDSTCKITSDTFILGNGSIEIPYICFAAKNGDSSIILHYDTNLVSNAIDKIYVLRKRIGDARFNTIQLETQYDGIVIDNGINTHRLDSFQYKFSIKDTCRTRDTSDVTASVSMIRVENKGLRWKVTWNEYEGVNYDRTVLYRQTRTLTDTTDFEVVDTLSRDILFYYQDKEKDVEFIYKLKFLNPDICTDSSELWTNTYDTDLGTIVNINEGNAFIEYYPNPTNHSLTINYNHFEVEQIKVFNILGSQVLYENFNNSNNGSIQLDLSSLNKGLYLIEIGNSSEFRVIKIQKD